MCSSDRTIYMRFAYCIDPGGFARIKFLPVNRHLRAWRKPRNQPTYEYNPVPLGNDLRDEVTKIIAGDDPAEGSLGVANEGVQIRQEGDRRALAMALQHLGQANEILGHLAVARSEEHTSELQSLMRISYAVFCLKNKIHILARTTYIDTEDRK